MSGHELARLLERHGWTLARVNGAHWTRIVATLLAISPLGLGCAPAGPGQSGGVGGSSDPNAAATVKRITLGTAREQDFRPTTVGPGLLALQMVHSGLSLRGDQRIRRPRLAEAVP